MKIDKTTSSLPASQAGDGSGRAPAAKTGNGASSSSATTSTNVTLGSTAAQLRSMESSMAGAPLVNAAKVAEIKQAISEGRFQINTGVVADRLIASVKDMFPAGSGSRG